MKLSNSNWNPYNDGSQKMQPIMQPIMMPDCPYNDMTEQQIEKMYPNIYRMVNPRVVDSCNRMEYEYGEHYVPCKQEVEAMVEDINKKVCADMDGANTKETSINQWRRGSSELPDLITILLLREIIGRRRRRYPRDPYGRGPRNPYGPGRYYY